MMHKHILTSLAVAGALALSGCATQTGSKPDAQETAKPAAAMPATQQEANLFIVFNDDLGRYYIFGDPALYRIFLDTGEVALARTFIGEGPEGASLVFGMTKDDARQGSRPTPGERLYKGEIAPSGPFYGEVLKDGRYYVFFTWPDMAAYLKHGEVPLTYTEIGVGPQGETVIYALNKDTAKLGRPEAAIRRFHALHPKKEAAAQ
jgi:predicted small secreted protein